MTEPLNSTDIAIIGMAGRFPGAPDLDTFWQNLCDGVESIAFFSDQQLAARGVDPASLGDPNFVKAAAHLDHVELFDAEFFGMNPREAELTDPQHRAFLECTWAALEHAGYDPAAYPGLIGVYAGATINTYLLLHIATRPDLVHSIDPLQINIGNGGDFLTTRVSYKLNLKGPSYLVQSACSTSLAAVHIACQSLLNEECDIALAGGVSINLSQRNGYHYLEGGMVSPDGHCRAFDASAQGTIFGSGVGVVVLKRLREARADGDTIYAVIKGSALNNDGALKVGYTAPSVDGQAEVIAEALSNAGVSAATIGYIEAHGTATPLGDPIEVQALTKAFRASTDRRGFCAIGSLKTNIGHLDAAAGVAGLIKTTLALRHNQIPPSLHFVQPNPNIDFANSPFHVNAGLSAWEPGASPRRAGVSSFGVGGTNAHIILEEPPPLPHTDTVRPWHMLVLSAKTPAALERATANLAGHLRRHPELNLADVAYTLQVGRQPMAHRRMLVCRDRDDALGALAEPGRALTGAHAGGERPVVFLFPGQGAQYVQMGQELYRTEPMFHEQVDRCAGLLLPHLGLDIRDVIYPTINDKVTRRQGDKVTDSSEDITVSPGHPVTVSGELDQTWLAQPALFVVEYALAQLWISWGVQPRAMIGHSIGEIVAACLAGVFSLEDALALVAARGRLMQSLTAGAMLAVPLPEEEIGHMLGQELALAAVNGPAQCVVAGPTAALERLEQQLAGEGVICRRLPASHAFHSQMIDPIVAPFVELVRQIPLHPPRIPYISNVSGTWISAAEVTDPAYWGRHMRQTVRFSAGLAELLRNPDPSIRQDSAGKGDAGRILLEVGPGQALSRLVGQHPAWSHDRIAITSLPRRGDPLPEQATLLASLGRLWLAGARVEWASLYAGEQRRRVALPSYPFERQRYWIEPGDPARATGRRGGHATKRPDIADWFFLPSWKRTAPPAPDPAGAEAERNWLVFVDGGGLGQELIQRLKQAGRHVFAVMAGERFERFAGGEYTVNPRIGDDYISLLADLRAADRFPATIVHLWSITADYRPLLERAHFQQAQEAGFYSLLLLAKALAGAPVAGPLRIEVISNWLCGVVYAEDIAPEKAPILAACKVIPQEHPHITCRAIDIAPPAGMQQTAGVVDRLLVELAAPAPGVVVAYRGHQRWVQSYEPVRLERASRPGGLLREGGVYLITGGLTGIGFALATCLAQTVRARLILIEDPAFPARAEWEHWLAAHDEQDDLSRKIRNVYTLEQAGAEVLVLGARIADIVQVEQAVQQAVEHFGALHGAIHAVAAGGGSAFQAIHETDPAGCERQFEPKTYGALALAQVLQQRSLDFCLLVSSLAAVLGGLGALAYTAANLALDAITQQQHKGGRYPWISVNWDAWRFSEEQAPSTHPAQFAMTRQEGLETFQRIMAMPPLGQLVVSTGDLAARIEQWIKLEGVRGPATAENGAATVTLHPRPKLATAYTAPKSDIERLIAGIWQQALGIDSVGVNDNFFDLGGDSLIAVQALGRLKQALGVDIPIASLYEGLTVRFLAGLLEAEQPAAQPTQPSAAPFDGRDTRIARKRQYQEAQRLRRREG